jgi:hypothetical protein
VEFHFCSEESNGRDQDIKLCEKVREIVLHGLPEFMKINVAIAVGKYNSNAFNLFPGNL